MAVLKKVTIDELVPGNFVADVVQQSGDMRVKKGGWVRTPAMIQALRAKGITEVLIDPDRQMPVQSSSNAASIDIDEDIDVYKSEPLLQELPRAQKLYEEAKQHQRKVLNDIQADKPLDIAPAQNLCEQFLDSIVRNHDALTWMGHIKNKDDYLLEHSINVAVLMALFSRHLGFDKELTTQLALGALLHDVGKIKIPDKVLNKPGKLNEDEYELVKRHVEFSRDILKATPGVPALSLSVAEYHHERLDGNGYPYGIAGDNITIYQRMISICDVYDAITADRVYSNGRTPVTAFRILMDNAPSHFDPELVQQFIKCIGVHPVGTLVRLHSGRLGIVTESNEKNPLQPIVKVFYNTKYNRHIDIKYLDLGHPAEKDGIDSSVKADQFDLNINNYF